MAVPGGDIDKIPPEIIAEVDAMVEAAIAAKANAPPTGREPPADLFRYPAGWRSRTG